MTSWNKVVSLDASVGRTSCCQCSIFSPLCHWQIQRNDSSQEFDTNDIIWLMKTFLTIVLQLLVQSLIINCRHYIPIMRVSKLYTWCLSLMLLPFLIDVVATSHWHRCHFWFFLPEIWSRNSYDCWKGQSAVACAEKIMWICLKWNTLSCCKMPAYLSLYEANTHICHSLSTLSYFCKKKKYVIYGVASG